MKTVLAVLPNSWGCILQEISECLIIFPDIAGIFRIYMSLFAKCPLMSFRELVSTEKNWVIGYVQ